MISFYINGDKVEVQLENEKTVGDVLHSFELTCEENNAAVIGITVDGKAITAESFATFRDSFDEINGLDYDPTYQ